MKSNFAKLFACLTLLLWQITALAQTNPIIDDSFARSNTTVGSSAYSTNVTGPNNSSSLQAYFTPSTGGAYDDVEGLLWRIYDNHLVCATGTGYSPVQRLLRPASENALNQGVTLTTLPLTMSTEVYDTYLRDQSSGNGLVGKCVLFTGTTMGAPNAYAVIALHNSTGQADLVYSSGFVAYIGHQYICSFKCTGSSPTTATVSIADASAPTTVLATVSTTTSSIVSTYGSSFSDIESAGQAGVGTDYAWPITGIARIQTFNDNSPVVAGTISQTASTSSGVSLSATSATGGSSTYVYQWYASQTSGFTPGSGTAVSGATSRTPTISLANAGLWFVKIRATDATGLYADSAQFAVRRLATTYPTLNIGFAGDDITDYTDAGTFYDSPYQQTVKALQSINGGHRTVTGFDQSMSGSRSQDWISGSTYLTSAKSAWSAGGVQVVSIMVGAVDAFYGVPASTYGANLASMVSDLTSAGYIVILHNPYYVWSNWGSGYSMEQQNTLLQGYGAQIASLVNGTTVFQGDTSAYAHFAVTPYDLEDTVHTSYDGTEFLGGNAWPKSIATALGL